MHHLINGQWFVGAGQPMSSVCPATGRIVWQGRAASTAQAEQAVQAARAAFSTWSQCPLPERLACLARFKAALLEQSQALGRTISQEVGKPLWEAQTEVMSMVAKIDISIKAHAERTGEHVWEADQGSRHLNHRPHGVMVVLGPYNFPGHLPNGHVVPALIAGNTVVFKPSPYAPGVACLMAQCWQAAGLPDGVFNVVQGGIEVGQALVDSAEVHAVLMTGSYATGQALSQRLAAQPDKLLALEMGGNNPLVAWSAANMRAVVSIIVPSAFLSAGQRCTCARRLIVPTGTWGDDLLMRLERVLPTLVVGAWDALPEPFMGPVVSHQVAQQLLARQQALLDLGARALLPMRSLADQTGFLSPGLLDVTNVPGIPDEEIFGPLLQVHRAQDFDHALALANQTRYGLAAGLLCDDAALWARFWAQARAGIINWNKPTTGAASTAPFGGVGRSGNHRPSAYYAADYCAYPVAGMSAPKVQEGPAMPGLNLSQV